MLRLAVYPQRLDVMPDEALVLEAQQGDHYALEFLLGKFKQLVLQQARPYYIAGADREDLIQEGMIGLFKAIRDFEAEKRRPFHAFAVLCVKRQIITAIKTASRLKCLPLNFAHSLDGQPADEDTPTLMETLMEQTDQAPEDIWLDKVTTLALRARMKRFLSELEYRSITLYASGFSYHEIAKRLERPSRTIDRALYRGKRKVKILLTHKDR